jgi:transcription initiation factor IIE alpha subunit
MGQQEVADYLKDKAGQWCSSKEIASTLGMPIKSIRESLKRLRKSNRVLYKPAKQEMEDFGNRHCFLYKYED